MPDSRTLENRLILACARAEPDFASIEDLVRLGPDWRQILRKTERWGLSPLVHAGLRREALSGRVPAPVAAQLRQINHREVVRSVAQRTALGAILLKFAEAGLPVIVLKGAALATLVYPSPTFRTMGDIDLLVHRRDLDKADELLRRMGYSAPGEPESGVMREEWEHRLYVGGLEGSPVIEIHDEILRPRKMRPHIPVEDFWRRAQAVRIASVETLSLNPEDMLLQLALHFAREERFSGHVRTLCDIRELCGWHCMDWSRLAAQAKAYKMGKCLYFSLRLARDLAGAGIPSFALKDLRAGFAQLPLEDKFIGAVTRHEIFTDDPPRNPLWSLFHEVSVDLLSASRAWEECILICRRVGRWSRRPLRLSDRHGKPDLTSHPSLAARPSGAAAAGAMPSNNMRRAGKSCNTPGELAVTYDQSATDGVGAQLQRIYGLYALSRGLKVKYVHTPLGRVDYQGLMPLLAGRREPDFAARYNTFFSLPSDDFDLEECERIRPVEHLDEKTVEHYRKHAAVTGRPILLSALSGYGYTDRHPECYHAIRAVTPYRGYRPSGPIRVCMHVRRGDNVPPRKDRLQRLLSNAYYLRACNAVLEAIGKQGAAYVVRLHSEMPPRPYTLYPNMPGLYFDLEQPSTIGPEQNALEDFESLPNLETVLNVEAREALDDFATADVLILSLSSFSYLGGLLNPRSLVIYAPWWHPPLPDWLVADGQGNLDSAQLAMRVADYLRRRDSC